MAVSIAKITQGFDYNFFKKVTVTWSTFGGGTTDGTAEVFIPFPVPVQGFSLLNEDNSAVVQVSFNGQTVHDELGVTSNSKFFQYNDRPISAIWFKLTSGGSCAVSVRAWATR